MVRLCVHALLVLGRLVVSMVSEAFWIMSVYIYMQHLSLHAALSVLFLGLVIRWYLGLCCTFACSVYSSTFYVLTHVTCSSVQYIHKSNPYLTIP
jgi:hypothetical protein